MFSIQIDKQENPYLPGDEVKGRLYIEYSGSKPPDKIKVNLVWQTRGKGTVDTEIVDSQEFTAASIADGGRFKLTIPPEGPYSVLGRLLSIAWRVEVQANKKDGMAGVPITVSPHKSEVILNEVPQQVKTGGMIQQR